MSLGIKNSWGRGFFPGFSEASDAAQAGAASPMGGRLGYSPWHDSIAAKRRRKSPKLAKRPIADMMIGAFACRFDGLIRRNGGDFEPWISRYLENYQQSGEPPHLCRPPGRRSCGPPPSYRSRRGVGGRVPRRVLGIFWDLVPGLPFSLLPQFSVSSVNSAV